MNGSDELRKRSNASLLALIVYPCFSFFVSVGLYFLSHMHLGDDGPSIWMINAYIIVLFLSSLVVVRSLWLVQGDTIL